MMFGRAKKQEKTLKIEESERLQSHERAKKRHFTSVIIAILMVVILGLVVYLGSKNVAEKTQDFVQNTTAEFVPKAEIVDEVGHGQISERMKEFMAQLEQDFADEGYVVTRLTLPMGTSREVIVDLEGVEPYIKTTIERGAGVTAEDARRMLQYLEKNEIKAEYVDVRVEGKGYYK